MLRRAEWWAPKLAPAIGVAALTAIFADVAMSDVLVSLLVALAALAAGAVYVSVLNDLTDLESDARAGKANRLAGRRRAAPSAVAAGAFAGGVAAVLLLDPGTTAVLAYLGAFAAFTAYSAPPLRLKGRGLAGALADACGAVALPYAFVAAVVLSAAHRSAPGWLAAVSLLGLAGGVRGATWHQLGDIAADRMSGTTTWARRSTTAAVRLATWVALPVEVLVLLGLLVAAGAWAAPPAIVLYVLVELGRRWALGVPLVVVRPVAPSVAARVGYRLWLQDLLVVVLPFAVLVEAVVRRPDDLLALAAFVLLFPGTIAVYVRDVGWLTGVLTSGRRRAALGVSLRRPLEARPAPADDEPRGSRS